MDRWLSALQDMLNQLLWHPHSAMERWIILLVSFFVGSIVWDVSARAFGYEESGGGRSALLLLGGCTVMVVTMTAVKMVLPETAVWMMFVSGVAATLVVVAPMAKVLCKGNYMGGVISWAITMGAIAGCILLLTYAYDAVVSGSKDTEGMRSNKKELEQLIGPRR